MSEHGGEREAIRESVERAGRVLDVVPWWRPFKRQEAANDYKRALLVGALWEIGHDRPTPDRASAAVTEEGR